MKLIYSLKLSLFFPFLLLIFAALSSSAQVSQTDSIKVNKSPFNDLARFVKQKLENDIKDINAPFSVVMRGTIDNNGRLEPQTTEIPKVEGDTDLAEIAGRTIEAVNESGYFSYLSELGAQRIKLAFIQDTTDFSIIISFDSESDSRSRLIKTSLETALKIALTKERQGTITESDKETLKLLNATTISTDKSNVVISTIMKKSEFHEILLKQLRTFPI